MFVKTRLALLTGFAISSVLLSQHDADAQNLTLNASIDTGCTVGTGNIDFGTIDATSGGSAISTVTITFSNCLQSGNVANAVANASVDSGGNGVGEDGLRQLQHDTLGDKIEYTLTETSNGAVAPNGTVPVNISGGTGSLVFDASIASSDVTGKSAGTYTDAVGITVSFL